MTQFNQSNAYLVFSLSETHFAFRLTDIKEIFALPILYQPPGMPPLLAGFAELEKQSLPVLDLACLLNLPGRSKLIDQHLILLRQAALFCLVDRVQEICALEAGIPLPENHLFNDWVREQLSYKTHNCYLLDSQKLLLKEEQARLQGLREITQQRLLQLGRPTS